MGRFAATDSLGKTKARRRLLVGGRAASPVDAAAGTASAVPVPQQGNNFGAACRGAAIDGGEAGGRGIQMTNAKQGAVCLGQAGAEAFAPQGAAHCDTPKNSGPIRLTVAQSFPSGSRVKLAFPDGNITYGVVVETVRRGGL